VYVSVRMSLTSTQHT